MKNIEEWVEWVTRNPELAEKYYPEIMQGINDRIKSSEPYLTALIIQKLPDHFPNWKTEAEKYFGITRTKKILGYIDLIKVVLIEYDYPSEIEQNAVESVRAELTEQLKYWENEIQDLPPLPKTKTDKETENDFILSTIEDWLFEFKEKMNEADYKNLVSALIQYFETGIFPTLSKPIQINGRLNKKLFGWALNRIFEAKGKGVEKELLQFAKQNISVFTDVQFDEKNIFKSNLYKYFTTQTK
jgi:hypothetical protein